MFTYVKAAEHASLLCHGKSGFLQQKKVLSLSRGMRILRLKSKIFLYKIFWNRCRDILKSRFHVEGSWESSDLLNLIFGS